MLHDSYFTLSFIARKARALRNGEYPIFVRITVSGQISEMNLGRSVAPENWDQKRAMSKGRSRRDLELNKYIEVVKARFLEIHNMLVREGGKDGESENTPRPFPRNSREAEDAL